MTVLWALSALRNFAKRSFAFSPQIALFQGAKNKRKLDIVCVMDGKLAIGEAKPSFDRILESDLADLASVVNELDADIAVLAARRDSKKQSAEKVKRLKALVGSHVEIMPLLCEWEDSPSLFLTH